MPTELLVERLDTVDQYLRFFERTENWNRQLGPARILYRGQPGPFGTLLPAFARRLHGLSPTAARLVERKLATLFRDRYSSAWDISPKLPGPAAIAPPNDQACFSLMQHYGVPTRMLDWTLNPWVAAFFACSKRTNTDVELWYFSRGLMDHQRTKPDETVGSVFAPHFTSPHLVLFTDSGSPRMNVQQAVLSICSDPMADHALLLQDMASSVEPGDERAFLGKLLISPSCATKLHDFLRRESKIDLVHLFPDIHGLSQLLEFELESFVGQLS